MASGQKSQLIDQDHYRFKKFSTGDGLSQRSVTDIVQDNIGFIWVGTRYGLNRFDGKKFKNYNYNLSDSTSLSNNWITSLAVDEAGGIWIGTKTGLNKYNPVTDAFIRINPLSIPNKIHNKTINHIISVSKEKILIGTNDGLFVYNIIEKHLKEFDITKFGGSGRLSSKNITNLLKDSRGNFWVCNAKAIDYIDQENKTITSYAYPNNGSPEENKHFINTLVEEVSGKIWLGYYKGLAFFDVQSSSFKDYNAVKCENGQHITSSVRSILQDNNGQLWIGTYIGLYKLDTQTANCEHYIEKWDDSESLSNNSIYSIIQDLKGDIWIGTWAGGLNYLDLTGQYFNLLDEGVSKTQLNYGVVSSIAKDHKGNLLIGTEGGGLNYYKVNEQKFDYISQPSTTEDGIAANNIKVITKRKSGDFLIGTHGSGILKAIPDKTTYKLLPLEHTGALKDKKITSIAEDKQGNIWIGTNEGGLHFYDSQTKKYTSLRDPHWILGNFIYKIINSSDGTSVYVGGENGLAKVDLKSKKIVKLNFLGREKDLYAKNQVISIYESPSDELWIGTEGEGLYRYNLSDGKSNRYGLSEGMPNETIYAIEPDDRGGIWMSTNKGICRLDPESGEILAFDEKDGLQSNEFNYGASHKDENGILMFGGISGLTFFDPSSIKSESYTPPLEVTAFNIDNETYLRQFKSNDPIELEHSQNDFSFEYTALNFSNPSKTSYQYKLEGLNNDWIEVGNETTARFTNIGPGEYVFSVKTANTEDPNQISIPLIINKPYWHQWWAYFLYGAALISLFLAIRKFTIQRMNERAELFRERLERERVEKTNQLKLQLFTNISHDFRTPLTLIIGPLKKLMDNYNKDEKLSKQLKGMYRNANTLLQLINQLLDFRKSEAGKLKLAVTQQNIVNFVREVKLAFEELASERKIDYRFTSDQDSHAVWFDTIEMKKVILNLLSNAFKFTPEGGSISIRITSKDQENIQIQIEDSGKGIREEDMPYVFDRFFQLGQEYELRSGTGVGLALAKDIVELHNGELFAESTINKGTRFVVNLKYGKDHFSDEMVQIIDIDAQNENVTLDQYNPNFINNAWINDSEPIKNDALDEQLQTILLVEDNPEVRKFIKDIFIDDFNILEAQNGKDGLNIARASQVDIIISDVMMPEMDGMELCNRIKKDIVTSHIPVVLLTARTSSKVQKQGYQTGADVYITKPFQADLLKLQVSNLLLSRKNLIDGFRKSLIMEPKELSLPDPDDAFLRNLMQIVEDNLSDSSFLATTLTEKMNMSQSVLYKKLKALTGESISGFIRSVRLKRSAQLLIQTNLTVLEITYEVGYNDKKYFRKVFKDMFDMSPTQYRKETKITRSDNS